MLRRAQVQFVKKQFDRALTLSLTALQELNKSSTENITSLEHISRQNVPDKNIQDETKCMAIFTAS
jgi:predicted FMN-binding regulatory protein PaiB